MFCHRRLAVQSSCARQRTFQKLYNETVIVFSVPGGFTSWSDWGQCSTSCGSGIQQRTRTCTNPTPAHGGMGCELLGRSLHVRNCSLKECPGMARWSNSCSNEECTYVK